MHFLCTTYDSWRESRRSITRLSIVSVSVEYSCFRLSMWTEWRYTKMPRAWQAWSARGQRSWHERGTEKRELNSRPPPLYFSFLSLPLSHRILSCLLLLVSWYSLPSLFSDAIAAATLARLPGTCVTVHTWTGVQQRRELWCIVFT